MIHDKYLFTGAKRPPALHCTSAEPVNAEHYEICMIEPLHDLKNLINRIMSELPHAIRDTQLKELVEDNLSLLGGTFSILQKFKLFKMMILTR